MSFVFALLGVLLALVAGFVLWRIVATVLASQRRTDAIMAEIRSVTSVLEQGRPPRTEDIHTYAARPDTRNTLLETLHEHGQEALFPSEYATAQAIAESDLVFWLCHPNELQAPPDEIEWIGAFRRTLEPGRRTGTYHLFRYRVKPPHWAAPDGWMAGVAGPHLDGEEPPPAAPGTFSRFEAWDSRTPDEHVDATHQLMLQKGVYTDLPE